MSNSKSAQGYLILLFYVLLALGFAHEGFWVLAFIVFIVVAYIVFVNIVRNFFQSPQGGTIHPPEPPPPHIPPPIVPIPDDLDNILRYLSNGEIKDPVTQDIFRPGENVYLCHIHRLAYHEDSWQEIGCQCMVCGKNLHTKLYVLPSPIDSNTSPTRKKTEQITWTDIDDSALQANWIDISSNPSVERGETVIDRNYFAQNVPDDLDNILKNVIGTTDPYSQEKFKSGESVYLCRRCRLAYHDDSWKEINCKCRDCKNDKHVVLYQLPF